MLEEHPSITTTVGRQASQDSLCFAVSSCVILLCCVYWRYLHNIGDSTTRFLVSAAIMFCAYGFCVARAVKAKPRSVRTSGFRSFVTGDLFWILIFSLLFRLTLISVLPSDDIYRYLWEGKLMGLLISPYRYPPESSALFSIRDVFYPMINHKGFSSIYPPFCQYIFLAADLFSHSIASMKSVFVLFDMLTIVVLWMILEKNGINGKKVLIYAYNPLVLFSVAAHGHNDSLFVFFLMASILALKKEKYAAAHVLLAVSFLSKFIFVFFWPVYIRKTGAKYVPYFIGTVLLLSLPLYSTVPALFDVLFRFGRDFRFNDSIHLVFYGMFSIFFERKEALLAAKVVVIGVLSLSYFYLAYKTEDILQFGFYFTAVFLLCLPTVHPWYLLWIIPFLVFFPNRAWIMLTGTMFLYFIILSDFNYKHVWRENQLAHACIYIPFYVILMRDFVKRSKYKSIYPTNKLC